MATSTSSEKLNIAIYGGGIAGATLIQALSNSSQFNLLYFDPKSDLTAADEPFFCFYPSSHDALSLVNKEASEAITKAGWFAEASSLAVLGQGPFAGSTVHDFAGLHSHSHWPQVVVVQPSAFLSEMLKTVNPRNLLRNKKLVSVEQTDREIHPLDLKFEDGSIYQVDVLLGDDGPNQNDGKMRGLVLGLDHPATKPVFEHYFCVVGMIPPDEDQASYLGPKYGTIQLGRRRYEHIGKDAWVMNEPVMRSILGTFYTSEPYDITQPLRPTSLEELQMRFGEFEQGPGIASALFKFSGGVAFPEIAHEHAPTFLNGLVAIMGNSAHKMTSFQQLGFGQQIEDAMVLGAVLSEATNSYGLASALFAYDTIRRPRSQWVADHAKLLGQIWHGNAGTGLDCAKLNDALKKWWMEWEAFDVSAHREAAVRVMRRRLAAAGY